MGSSAIAQSTTNPSEYMTYFSVEYLQIQKDMWDYTKSVSHGKSARTVEKRRAELIQSVSTSLAKAKQAKPYNEQSAYRDSVIKYFDMIGIVLREDYAEIVDMEAISEQSYDAMEAYMTAREMASDKLAEASKMISAEHLAFAAANDVTIIESEDSKLDLKIEIANKVYDHYNAVYLVFFKSYKQEAYLLDAIGRKDVSAIEQNRNALLETAEEGRTKLKAIDLYEGDQGMITATRDLLNFYTDEGEKDVTTILNFMELSDGFNAIKTAFDSKKEKARTEEDYSTYNDGVNNLNKAVENYNAMNEASNKKRGNLIDTWNKDSEKFTTKHVPRGK
jgi:hypothetical protein